MVYFHGGAYGNGTVTDPLTHGAALAEAGDVVVVSVNHRLNALGYLWLQPFGARYADSGNLGQLDLIVALQWVRDHIAAFGGDSARVMVFGQSGGGAKIATLMAMPAARGLFHAAATMSGQQVVASGPAHLAALGLRDPADLHTMPLQRLVEGLSAVDPVMGGGVYFGPVLDGTNLPRHPFYPDAAQQSLGVPMILGNVQEETRAFLDPRGAKLAGLSWDNLGGRIAAEVKVDLEPGYVVAQYRAHHPDWTPEQVYYAATTAGRSWVGQVIEADARAAAGADKTWVYCLTRRSPVDPLRGAAHTDDIPYVFGTLGAQSRAWGGSYSGTDAGAMATRDLLQRAFVRLAKTGQGSWAPYRLPERATLLASENPRVENDPRGWERQLWATAPYVQPGG
jgi:para-nitrobenzyl esterase